MMLLDELLQLMIGMSDAQLRKIKKFILMKLSIKTPLDTKDVFAACCPHCKSNHIIKCGLKNGKQRFFCKGCQKLFMPSTSTVTFKSKHSIDTWSNYISCMSSGMTLRESANVCDINRKTAFYWRHKVMGSLEAVLDGRLALQDIVDADETFFPVYKSFSSQSAFFLKTRGGIPYFFRNCFEK